VDCQPDAAHEQTLKRIQERSGGCGMHLDFEVMPNRWPSAGFYAPSDVRRVVGGFLNADVGTCPAAIQRYLEGIEQVRRGQVREWRWTGDAFAVVVQPEGCYLRQYYPPPAPGYLGECQLSHDELADVLRAWKDHVVAVGWPPTTAGDGGS
jgi:hypothetical protein